MHTPRIVGLLFLVCLAGGARAANVSLTTTGDWSTGANWNIGVPTAADAATVAGERAVTVTASGAAAARLTLGSPAGGGKGGLPATGGTLTLSGVLTTGSITSASNTTHVNILGGTLRA